MPAGVVLAGGRNLTEQACQGCGKAIGRQVQPVVENKVGLCVHKVGL